MPRFIVARSDLLAALAATKIVERRHTIPILGNALLSADEATGTLSVTGTDLDIETTIRAPAEVIAPGTFTLPAQALTDIVKRFSASARIEIVQDDADHRAVLISGKSRLTLYSLPAADFPRLDPAGEAAHRLVLAGTALAGLLKPVEPAIGKDETRWFLMGTFLHPGVVDGAATLRACAADGIQLIRAETTAVAGVSAAMDGIIVPGKTARELRTLATTAGSHEVTIEIVKGQIRVTTGETTLVSKLIEGTFPDPARYIPFTNDRTLTVDRSEIVDALGRLAVLATTKDRDIKLTLEPDRVRLAASGGAGGMGEDEAAGEYEGPAMSLAFSAPYIVAILDAIEADTVRFDIGPAPGSPVLIRASADASTVYVLSPMRA